MYIKSKMYKYIYLCHLPYSTSVLTWDLFILPSETPENFALHCDFSIRGGWVRLAVVLGVLLLV